VILCFVCGINVDITNPNMYGLILMSALEENSIGIDTYKTKSSETRRICQ